MYRPTVLKAAESPGVLLIITKSSYINIPKQLNIIICHAY